MNEIIPIFSSSFSIGKSTLTLDKAEKIDVNKPVSIFSIAKTYKLPEVFLVESRMGGFIDAYENAKKSEIPLRFGIKLTVCADLNEKSDESLKTEHKIIVWLKNTKNQAKSLNRIYTKAATDGFYYCPRIDLKHLVDLWDDDLKLSIPSYSSFLHKNILRGHQCVIDFNKIKPTIFYSSCNLPFDPIIQEAHINYANNNKLEYLEVSPVYFYSEKQFFSYNVFKCITNRSIMSMPKLDHFSSKEFSFESFLKKISRVLL